jgi:hypothetical protein
VTKETHLRGGHDCPPLTGPWPPLLPDLPLPSLPAQGAKGAGHIAQLCVGQLTPPMLKRARGAKPAAMAGWGMETAPQSSPWAPASSNAAGRGRMAATNTDSYWIHSEWQM